MTDMTRLPGKVWRGGMDYMGSYAAPAGEVCHACRTVVAPDAMCYRSAYWDVLCVACALAGDA